ncbi:MAG: hypothetical protein VX899_26960 [Myxococcota bacterium]|nr:hypothetical protein [Myxococcota bacterium]
MFIMLALGCAKISTIQVEETAQVTIEKGTLLEDFIGDMGFDEFVTMDLTESSELANQGVEPGDVQEVTLTSFSLTALEPEDADLSFIDSMDVTVEGPDLPLEIMATADDFPEGQASVEFELTQVDITDYVTSERMSIGTDVSAHRPEQDTLVEAAFTVSVRVTAQGVRNNL